MCHSPTLILTGQALSLFLLSTVVSIRDCVHRPDKSKQDHTLTWTHTTTPTLLSFSSHALEISVMNCIQVVEWKEEKIKWNQCKRVRWWRGMWGNWHLCCNEDEWPSSKSREKGEVWVVLVEREEGWQLQSKCFFFIKSFLGNLISHSSKSDTERCTLSSRCSMKTWSDASFLLIYCFIFNKSLLCFSWDYLHHFLICCNNLISPWGSLKFLVASFNPSYGEM